VCRREGGRKREAEAEGESERDRAGSLSLSLSLPVSLLFLLSLLSLFSLSLPLLSLCSLSALSLSLCSLCSLARALSLSLSHLSLYADEWNVEQEQLKQTVCLSVSVSLILYPSCPSSLFLFLSLFLALPSQPHTPSLVHSLSRSPCLPEPPPVTPLHPSFTSPLLLNPLPLRPSTPLSPLSVQGLNASIPWRASAIPGVQGRYPRRLFRAWQCRARAGGTGGLQLGHHVNCLWRCSGLALQ
jgi:hypothetical protein